MQATVLANGGTVFLPVDIDLAGVPTGTYVLALRPAHDNEEWQICRLVLKRAPEEVTGNGEVLAQVPAGVWAPTLGGSPGPQCHVELKIALRLTASRAVRDRT